MNANHIDYLRGIREEAMSIRPARRLHLLNKIFSNVNSVIERNVRRFNTLAHVMKIGNDNGGNIGVIVTSRDCDMCESTYGTIIPAAEFEAWVERLYYDAEGPVSYHVVTPKEADSFNGSFRDLALEAFEDGHPHVIYG